MLLKRGQQTLLNSVVLLKRGENFICITVVMGL